MAVTLTDLYDVQEQLLEDIDGLRADISGGLFAMLRRAVETDESSPECPVPLWP